MSELRFCFFPQDAFELQWMSLPDLALELKCVWWLGSLRHGRISEIQQTAENRATELAHFWKLRVKTRLHKALSKPWLRNTDFNMYGFPQYHLFLPTLYMKDSNTTYPRKLFLRTQQWALIQLGYKQRFCMFVSLACVTWELV